MEANRFDDNRHHQTIIVQQANNKTNGLGTAGFILSLSGLVFCWIPVLDGILWVLGLIFSFCGVSKEPRGLAIAGLVISFIVSIILAVLFAVFVGFIDEL